MAKGGYFQTLEGLPDLNDPTQYVDDDAYRDIVRAKAIANNVDGTLVDIYNYLVNGYEQTNPTVEDEVGIVNVTIADNDLLTQGERNRIFAHGPRPAGVDLRFLNWTFEYTYFTTNTTADWSIEQGDFLTGYDGEKYLVYNGVGGDFAYNYMVDYFDVTASESAYGTWDIWPWKINGASDIWIVFACTQPQLHDHASQDGYALKIDSNEALSLIRLNSGSATELFKTANSYVSLAGPVNFNVVRDSTGQFTVKMNGASVTVASGSNPVTDNSITSCGYWVIDLDQDDAIALVDIDNDLTYWKSTDTNLVTYIPL